MPALVHLERQRYRWLAGTGALGAGAAFLLLVVLIWSEEALIGWQAPVTVVTMAFAANHASLMLLAQAREGVTLRALQGTLVVIGVLEAMLTVAVWPETEANAYVRLVAAPPILSVLGTFSVPLPSRIAHLSTARREQAA